MLKFHLEIYTVFWCLKCDINSSSLYIEHKLCLILPILGIHRLKQNLPKRKAGLMAKAYDPIAPIAEEISEEACLLCFDEFQVRWKFFF